LAYGFGHTFTDGYHFTVNITSPLERWDGAAFVNDSGAEAVGAFRGDATAPADQLLISGLSTTPQSLVFSNISSTYDSDAHSSMRFRMLGDGASALVTPADGLYLLTLQITSTHPIYFMLYKNASVGEINTAIASLHISSALVQVVAIPEPGGIAMATLAILGIGSRRLRRNDRGQL
jgi:hypothetical protein